MILGDDFGAFVMIPAVGQQHPAHVKQNCVKGKDRRLRCVSIVLVY
jgi:hypothetical protein